MAVFGLSGNGKWPIVLQNQPKWPYFTPNLAHFRLKSGVFGAQFGQKLASLGAKYANYGCKWSGLCHANMQAAFWPVLKFSTFFGNQ